MCGIVGIINFDDSKINSQELNNFKNSLIHRGPDGSGTFINPEHTIGFGHTRLSILDLSNLSDQPMTYDDKRYTITYNGEIYNFLEIKKELLDLGYKFKSKGDTEVILAAYKQWGEKCQLKFNGMWAFAIWDQKNKNLFISRDRFGVKPLYYLEKKGFYFASELKSFMFLEKSKRPNFDYSSFINDSKKYTNNAPLISENTFLINVKELPPGHQIVINNKKDIKIKKWWSTIDNLTEIPKNYNDQVEKFREIFFDACKIRMRSDVEIATSSSGGLDSSSIISAISTFRDSYSNNSNTSYPYNTFILDYKDELDNETQYAKAAAENFSLNMNLVELDYNNINPDEIIKSIYFQEHVSGDDGLGPWNIYKNIKKKNIKVSIDGHGADELLGGYSGYPMIAMKECSLPRDILRWIDLLQIHLKMNTDINEEANISKMIFSKLHSIFREKIRKKSKDEYDIFINKSSFTNSVNWDDINSLSLLNKHLYIDYHYKSLQINLNKYDKFSMAHGIESRFPFLDWRLATYLFSLPSDIKIKNGFSKKILRDAMKNDLNKKICRRVKKKGFNPTNELFDKKMSSFIKNVINSKEFSEIEIFDKNKIKELLIKKELNYKSVFKFIQIFYLIKTFNNPSIV